LFSNTKWAICQIYHWEKSCYTFTKMSIFTIPNSHALCWQMYVFSILETVIFIVQRQYFGSKILWDLSLWTYYLMPKLKFIYISDKSCTCTYVFNEHMLDDVQYYAFGWWVSRLFTNYQCRSRSSVRFDIMDFTVD
jgi:hypothetical protein